MDGNVNLQGSGVMDGNVNLQGSGLTDDNVNFQGSGVMDDSVNLQGSGLMDDSVNLQGSGLMDDSVNLQGLQWNSRWKNETLRVSTATTTRCLLVGCRANVEVGGPSLGRHRINSTR